MADIDLLIPTMDNTEYIYPCVRSIIANTPKGQINKIFVINNGESGSLKKMKEFNNPMIEILDLGENRGWQGGLQAGLAQSKTQFVIFMNDDTFVPPSSKNWLELMGQHFNKGSVGAVGPCSNRTPGFQDMNIFPEGQVLKVPFLTGFCLFLDRVALDKCGGVDTSVKFGDDIDLSFRLRKSGYDLLADRRTFVFHRGGITGKKVHSAYYDSDRMISDMCDDLASKYGRLIVDKEYRQPKCEVFV